MQATFKPDLETPFVYKWEDIKNVVTSPPKYVKITKTPENGKLVVKKYGKWTVLNNGDLIETSMLKEFIYDQDKETECSEEDKSKCNDKFSYIPYGEWEGKGNYQKTVIKFNPVVRDTGVEKKGQPKIVEPIKDQE